MNRTRLSRRISLLIMLILSSFTIALAQNSSVETLRTQLSDAQKKEEQLQARVKQIEEDMKPENIEKVFALNGSTRPEELREHVAASLKAKGQSRAQLDLVIQSRARLETAIVTEQSAAYRQSALQVHPPTNPAPVVTTPDSPT